MNFIEDDFDLEEYKKTFAQKIAVEAAPKGGLISALVSVFLWILAFLVAYPLFRGGQYLIDLFIK